MEAKAPVPMGAIDATALLLPCPFCREPAELFADEHGHSAVGCTNPDCNAMIRTSDLPGCAVPVTSWPGPMTARLATLWNRSGT